MKVLETDQNQAETTTGEIWESVTFCLKHSPIHKQLGKPHLTGLRYHNTEFRAGRVAKKLGERPKRERQREKSPKHIYKIHSKVLHPAKLHRLGETPRCPAIKQQLEADKNGQISAAAQHRGDKSLQYELSQASC